MMIKSFAKKKVVFLTLVLCIGLFSCTGNTQKATGHHDDLKQPNQKTGTYPEAAAPEEQGIDSGILLKMMQKVKKEQYHIRSIIMIRNHKLVFESYIFPYNRDIPHNTKSASKSIISALVGIALREKWIESTDRTVYSYLPQYFQQPIDPMKKQITLRHLLTMTSGLKINEQTQDTNKIFSSPNPTKTMFEFPMAENPGEKFNYLTPIMNVMSLILTETSGKDLKVLADTYLFAPLGIKDVQWKIDPMGNYFTDAVLTPMEMAKFGMLFLDKGKWNGKQVVPGEWVEESTKTHVKTMNKELGDYGYWWWKKSFNSQDMYIALGWGGQGIFVIPGWNMVIVTTGANLGTALHLVYDFLLPAVKSPDPLSANPQKVDALRKMVRQLQFPSAADSRPIPDHPEIIKDINNVPYLIEPNNMGLIEMTFHFSDKTCHLSVVHERGTFERMEVGLDNIYRVSKARPWGEWPIHDKTALKGKWKNNNTFFLDIHPVGRAEQVLTDIQFQGEEINLSVALAGTDIRFPLKGKMKKVK